LISAHELIELQRLHEDRHLCAQLAFVAEEQLFTPNAELVRSHLRNAVASVLSQQPVQGKAALTRIVAEMTSDTFPHRLTEIERFMKARYLSAAKDSLVRSLVIMLLHYHVPAEEMRLARQ